jgi:transcriptional regulator with XRE-family HTH domain
MDSEPSREPPGGLRVVTLTADQVVALNLWRWRREAGLTQEAAGKLLGLSADNLGQAERSRDPGQPRRRFDAQAVAEMALALGVPVAALFLPPPDDGDGTRYLLAARERHYDMADMMALLTMPDNDDETPVMDAYRARFNEAAARYLSPQWASVAARLVGAGLSPQAAADTAALLRDDRAALLKTAERLGNLADGLDAQGGDR